jgi:recombination protein RecA
VVEKRGSYYYREGENLAQGRETAKQFLREHPAAAAEIEAIVREAMAPEKVVEPDVASDVEETGAAG